ncbi:hypothetical protein C9374_014666 [Naegleria lovaniensis]|uniref:Uncharacterized protein n=1 Tax=Naegleria lovaniensis TaxID=51637 RepID=A0AA88GVM5_NAELO|nr:uncharacterized protein C9374_014666 [Naegleria lovaniensis]KAG2389266.1 hypothetical protein C9374_014666 [Naegleria lovaniensis]
MSLAELDSNVISNMFSFGLWSALDIESLKYTCKSFYHLLSGGGGGFISQQPQETFHNTASRSQPQIHLSDSLRNQLESLYLPRVVIQIGVNVNFSSEQEQEQPYSPLICEIQKIFQNKCRKISSQEIEIEIQWPTNPGILCNENTEWCKIWKYLDSAHMESDKNGNREILTEFLHTHFSTTTTTTRDEIMRREEELLRSLDDDHENTESLDHENIKDGKMKKFTREYFSLHEETQLRNVNHEKETSESQQKMEQESYLSIHELLYSWKTKFSKNGEFSKLIDSKWNFNACRLLDKFILHIYFVPCESDRSIQYSTQQLEDSISASMSHPKRKTFQKVKNFIKPYGKIYDRNGFDKYCFLRFDEWPTSHAELKYSVFVKILLYYLFKDFLIEKIEKQCIMNLKQVYDAESINYLKTLLEEENRQLTNSQAGSEETVELSVTRQSLRNFLLLEKNVIKAYQHAVLKLCDSASSNDTNAFSKMLSIVPSSKHPSRYLPVLYIQEHLTFMSLENMNDRMRIAFLQMYLKCIFASELKISDSMRRHYEEQIGMKSRNGISCSTENSIHSLTTLTFTFETLEFDRTITKMKHNIVKFPTFPSTSLANLTHHRPAHLRLFEETSVLGRADRFVLEKICPVQWLCCCNASMIACCCCTTWWCGCYRPADCPDFMQWLGFPSWLYYFICDKHRWLPSFDCGLCCDVLCCNSAEEFSSFRVYKDATVNDDF